MHCCLESIMERWWFHVKDLTGIDEWVPIHELTLSKFYVGKTITKHDFKSRREALEAMSKRLKELLDEDKLACIHLSDNNEHIFEDEGGVLRMNKCQKCGEFFK